MTRAFEGGKNWRLMPPGARSGRCLRYNVLYVLYCKSEKRKKKTNDTSCLAKGDVCINGGKEAMYLIVHLVNSCSCQMVWRFLVWLALVRWLVRNAIYCDYYLGGGRRREMPDAILHARYKTSNNHLGIKSRKKVIISAIKIFILSACLMVH